MLGRNRARNGCSWVVDVGRVVVDFGIRVKGGFAVRDRGESEDVTSEFEVESVSPATSGSGDWVMKDALGFCFGQLLFQVDDSRLETRHLNLELRRVGLCFPPTLESWNKQMDGVSVVRSGRKAIGSGWDGNDAPEALFLARRRAALSSLVKTGLLLFFVPLPSTSSVSGPPAIVPSPSLSDPIDVPPALRGATAAGAGAAAVDEVFFLPFAVEADATGSSIRTFLRARRERPSDNVEGALCVDAGAGVGALDEPAGMLSEGCPCGAAALNAGECGLGERELASSIKDAAAGEAYRADVVPWGAPSARPLALRPRDVRKSPSPAGEKTNPPPFDGVVVSGGT